MWVKLIAHGLSIDAMRSLGTLNIGIVLNLTEVQQASDTQSDVSAGGWEKIA